MKKSIGQLADGREIIYFDTADDADRSTPDLRDLAPPSYGPEMRYDPFTDEWVGIAAQRQIRTFLPSTSECPLCPSRPGHASEIPAADYELVVIENRFPSFSGRAPETAGAIAATGRCEVVCFTADHHQSFADLSLQRVRLIIDALADRTTDLAAVPGIEQVFCFENRGVEIGVTLHHPHGQIYGYPFIAPYTARLIAAATRNPDMFAQAIDSAGDRVVAANDEWIAFVPYAARWPYEVSLFPRRRVADLAGLDDAARDAFGEVYLRVQRQFAGLFDTPAPYISAWQQAPVRHGRHRSWLHLRLFTSRRAADRLKYPAGSEAAMGAWVNDIRPEDAARALRAVTE